LAGVPNQKDPASGNVDSCRQKCDSLGESCVGFAWGGNFGNTPYYCTTFEGQCVDTNDEVTYGHQWYFKKLPPYITLSGSCGESNEIGWCPESKQDCFGSNPTVDTAAAAYESLDACKQKCNNLGSQCQGLIFHGGSDPSFCVTHDKCVDTGSTYGATYFKKRYNKLVGYCQGVSQFNGWCPESQPGCTGRSSRTDAVASASAEACADKCDSLGPACVAYVYGGIRLRGGVMADVCVTYQGRCTDSNRAIPNSNLQFFSKA